MPTNKRFTSLHNKLVWPFALLGLSVSCVLSIINFLVVADLDERNIRQSLQVELEDFRARKKRNPAAIPITTQLMQGYFLPSDARPELNDQAVKTHDLGGDSYRIITRQIDHRPRTILIDEVDGRILAIVHDDSGSRQMLIDLAWLLAGTTVVLTILATLLGFRLAGQVVRPISRLLIELNERSHKHRLPDEFTPLFDSNEYPGNEIGRLALALDEFAIRLHGFMRRERYFVGDISHELRTPIAIIRGAAEVAQEYPNLPDPVRDRLALIQRKSARLAELLDALLQLARESETGRSDTNDAGETDDAGCALAEVVEEATAECEAMIAGKPVVLSCECTHRPLLPVEKSMAYVVVSNLLRNACIHTQSGTVTATLTAQELTIRDTGVGIPAERFSAIFARYVKSEASPGTGLGLSIVGRMCDAMGWQIAISSQQGNGTTVVVTFFGSDIAATEAS